MAKNIRKQGRREHVEKGNMERLTFKAGGFNAFSSSGLCTYGGIQNDGSVIHIGSVADKLAAYEDLEEQGKLLKLPCAVGDTVYRICPKCNDAHNGSCKNCAWENSYSNRGCTVYGGWKDGQYPMGECTIVPYKVSWNYIPNLLENIGKRVFLTREEAEAALKEL